MAFQRPTLTDLVTRIEADYISRLTGGGSLLRRSFVYVLARVHAGAMHLLYGFAAFIAQQIIPAATNDPAYLVRWANFWGVDQKEASFTTFFVTITGVEGTLIPGTVTELVRSDGVLYTTNADAAIVSGTALVQVTAEDSGITPNVVGGEIFTFSNPIVGIDPTAVVSSSNIVDGAEQEDTDSLFERLKNRVQQPPNGGSSNDYVQWALEVAGVTRAWCYPLYYGTGTVGLTFVRDNDAGGIIPDAGEVAQVQTYIDDPSRAPAVGELTVFAPIASVLNFNISGVSDLTVRANIQAELNDLILREAIPGGTILLTHIQESISTAQGEVDHVLNSPSANVTSTAGHLTTMGTITWS